MKRKTAFIMATIFLLVLLVPFHVFADTGPKPSVNIKVEGYEGRAFYITLFSAHPSSGPHSAYNVEYDYSRYHTGDADYDIWEAFLSISPYDGFYFLQEFSFCEDGNYRWGYYPPRVFKVCIYFPDSREYVVSDTYETYAFDSYYKLTLSRDESGKLLFEKAEKNYNYGLEFISLAARIVITLALEILIALAFGYRAKKQILFIAVVNAVTNISLNVALNVFNYYEGQLVFMLMYVLLEIIVFIAEAVLYMLFLGRFKEREEKRGIYVVYALVSNAVSFGAGLVLAHIIPGIF